MDIFSANNSRQLEAVACGVGVAIGAAAHLCLFIHGEWHIQAPHIVRSHLAILIIAFSGAWYYADQSPLGELFRAIATASVSYIAALLLSILIYRIAPGLHRLTRAKFPGPWLLRTSKLWHVWKCRNSMNHFFLEDLFQRYGDFVRTGPSEITVFHPDVFAVTDGPGTECSKAEWYDLLHPDRALLTSRDRVVHDARRRDWKLGFINRALESHAEKALKHADILDEAIYADTSVGRPSAMRDLFYWYGFDLMGDFVMNKPFGMLSDKKWQHMVIRLQHALSLLGPASPAPWLIQLAFRLGPKIYQVRSWNLMAQWSWDEIHSRLRAGFAKQPSPDLIHYLLEETNRENDLESLYTMRGDTLQAIVAGSEPIPIVLLGIFSELVQAPQHQELIYQELVNHGIRSVDVENYKALGRLSHLNAVIQEALRLYPVLLTGAPRKSGSNGVIIAGKYIPPHTTIVSPRYSIQRSK
ncbi:Tryprostatin B 6-hydroxylase [Cytospora mali]|uniref:Tryprostatin B 6-hydroxylase n=1 Tax=Cytospora mali TaxID=578113 RepID=A0A194VJT6_CYTMA|nr:Tryprostatin B 6-hydroxylase [Valsa mali]